MVLARGEDFACRITPGPEPIRCGCKSQHYLWLIYGIINPLKDKNIAIAWTEFDACPKSFKISLNFRGVYG
jgi:hypothetical protein